MARREAGSVSEQIDQELVAAALRKRKQGERPTEREATALRRWEAAKEEKDRWRFYESIPKRHYVAMSGRQVKVLHDQARRYNLPLEGKTVSLPRVLRAFHDFLADNAAILSAAKGLEDPMLGGGDSDALEEYRRVRTLQERIRLRDMQGDMIPRAMIHGILIRGAAVLKETGEFLVRQYGEEAGRLFADGIQEMRRVLDSLLTHGDSPSDSGAPAERTEPGDLRGNAGDAPA